MVHRSPVNCRAGSELPKAGSYQCSSDKEELWRVTLKWAKQTALKLEPGDGDNNPSLWWLSWIRLTSDQVTSHWPYDSVLGCSLYGHKWEIMSGVFSKFTALAFLICSHVPSVLPRVHGHGGNFFTCVNKLAPCALWYIRDRWWPFICTVRMYSHPMSAFAFKVEPGQGTAQSHCPTVWDLGQNSNLEHRTQLGLQACLIKTKTKI